MVMRRIGSALSLFLVFAWGALAPHAWGDDDYVQTNLVSDIAGVARNTDANLVNPWGIALGPNTAIWVADNGSGVATVYNRKGQPFPSGTPLVVTIPPPAGSPAGTTAAPTGAIFNDTSDFVVSESGMSGPSLFVFATEDGTISGWNPNVDVNNAILEVDNSGSGAVYKGLALLSNKSGDFLAATNFHNGTVDVFDGSFGPATLAGSFTDPNLPAGFAPFGIRNISGELFVSYAKQNAEKHDDVAGPGNGFVDIFDTDGNLVRRFASAGTLNSPWGLVLAPKHFGRFSEDLLVGNFGDGRINAFDPHTGEFLGQLENEDENPITISGVWALVFGNGTQAGGSRKTLFFSAGIADEQHGLFGTIQAAKGKSCAK
jgi:uncharacterized protein (TIGR03118 family)